MAYSAEEMRAARDRLTQVYSELDRVSSKKSSSRPTDPMAVDTRGTGFSSPDGYRRMTEGEKIVKGIGDIGETIYGLSGFSENWEKTKQDAKAGTLDAGQVIKTIGSFGLSLPLGIFSAPFSMIEKGYEALSGTPTQEAIDDTWIPDYTLDSGQRWAAGADAVIDALGIFTGGTGKAVTGTAKTIAKPLLSGIGKEAFVGLRPGEKAVTAAKAALDQLKIAGGSADDIAKATKAWKDARRKSGLLTAGYDVTEEGLEEFSQSILEDIRGSRDAHGQENISLSKAIESGLLGALGGLVFSGFATTAHNIVEDSHEKVIDKILSAKQLDTSWTKKIAGSEDILATVREEITKDIAKLKVDPASGISVGQMWVPPAGERPNAVSFSITQLIYSYEKEPPNGVLHQTFGDFTYDIGGKSVGLIEAFEQVGQEARRQAGNNKEQFIDLANVAYRDLSEALTEHMKKNNRTLRLGIGKNPGGKVAYVDCYVANINPGASIGVTNSLAVSINADIDGDNYTYIFVDKDGYRNDGTKLPVGSIWEAFGQAIPGKIKDGELDWDKVKIILGLKQGLSRKAEFISGIYQDLKQEAQEAIDEDTFKILIEDILVSVSEPKGETRTKNAIKFINDLKSAPFKDVPTMLAWLFNNIASDADQKVSRIYNELIDPGATENITRQDLVDAVEKETGGQMANAMISAAADKTAKISDKNKIHSIGVEGSWTQESAVSYILNFFGCLDSVFDSDTRQNLTMYQMTKSYAEHAYKIFSKSASSTEELLSQMTESVFSQLIRDDIEIIARGEHPMAFPAALARKYAYSMAIIKRNGNTFKDLRDIQDFCKEHLKETWDEEKRIWNETKRRVYGSYNIESMDVDMFSNWNDADYVYNFYQCVFDMSPSDIIVNGSLNSSIEYYVAAAVRSDSVEFMQDATQEEVELILAMKNAIIKKNHEADIRIREDIKDQLAAVGVKKDLDEIAANGYELDKIKDAGLYGFLRAHLNWVAGLTRSQDLRSIGIGSVERILAAASLKNDTFIGSIARGLLSSDPETVINAVTTLAHYVTWMDPRAIIDKTTGDLSGFEYNGVYSDVYALANMDPEKADISVLSENLENIMWKLNDVFANSKLYSRIVSHYGSLLMRAIDAKNPKAVIGIAKDFNKLLTGLMDTKATADFKQQYTRTVLDLGEEYDNFLIDTITKEMDIEDMSTPSSRLSAVAPYAKTAQQLTSEYIDAQCGSWMAAIRDPHTPEIGKTMDAIGKLYELEAMSGQQQIMVNCADNTQRFMITRARKTQSTAASSFSWDTLSRTKIGFIPSETSNMAYAGNVVNWFSIEESPGMLGMLCFTDWIEEEFGGSGLKIVFPDGNFVVVSNKWDMLRLFMDEKDYAKIDRPDTTWSIDIIEAILRKTPSFINVINPIVYSSMSLEDGTQTSTPSHKWRIGGWEESVQRPGERKSNYSSLHEVIMQDNFNLEVESEMTSQMISNILFSDRSGMLLYTGAFKDDFFDEDKSYDQIAKESYRASRLLAAAAKGIITGNAERARRIKNGLLYGSMAEHFRNASGSLDRPRGFVQALNLMIADTSNDINIASFDLAFDLLFGENGLFTSGDIEGVGRTASNTLEQISAGMQKMAEGSIDEFQSMLVEHRDFIEAMAAIDAIAKLDISSDTFRLNGELSDKRPNWAVPGASYSRLIEKLDEEISRREDKITELRRQKASNRTPIIIGEEKDNIQKSIDAEEAAINKLGVIKKILTTEQAIEGGANIGDIKIITQLQDAVASITDPAAWTNAVPALIKDIEDRRGETVRTAADIMAGRVNPFDDAFAEAYREIDPKDSEAKRAFIRRLLFGFVYSRGQNLNSTSELSGAIDKFVDDVRKEFPQKYLHSQFVSSEEEELINEIIEGKHSLAFSSDSHVQFATTFINEMMSGNSGYGVSFNSRERTYFLPALDIPADIEAGGEADFTDTIWSPAYWDGKTKGDVYREYAKLGDSQKRLFVGSYKSGNKYMPITEAIINSWINSDEPLPGRLYLLGSYNAGFDHRYWNPDLTGNPNYRGYNLELGTLLLQCAEAMNLKSKKKSNIFSLKTYALEDKDSRKTVGDIAVIDAATLSDRRKLMDAIEDFKVAYAATLDELYKTDPGHEEVGFSFAMWKMFVDHQVQKIVIRDNDTKRIYTFAIKDIIDGTVFDQNTTIGQLFATAQSLPNASAHVDVMTAQELGASLQRGITAERGSNSIMTRLTDDKKSNAQKVVKKNQDFAQYGKKAIDRMRAEHPDYGRAAAQLRERVSRMSFKQSQYTMLETSGLDGSFKVSNRPIYGRLFEQIPGIRENLNAVSKDIASLLSDNKITESLNRFFGDKNGKIKSAFIPVRVYGSNGNIKTKQIETRLKNAGYTVTDNWINQLVENGDREIDGISFCIFVEAGASASDIRAACNAAARSGLPVVFQDSKDARKTGNGKDVPLPGLKRKDAKSFGSVWGYYYDMVYIPEKKSFVPPRYQHGTPFTLGISSPFLPPKDGGGVIWTESNMFSLKKETSDTITLNGDILTAAEVQQLLKENGVTPSGLGSRLTQDQLAKMKIVIPKSTKRVQKETGPDMAFVGPVSNYLSAISSAGQLQSNTTLGLDFGGGLVCIGLYRENGYLSPIIIGPISQFDELSVTMDKKNPRRIHWSTTENTYHADDRGETQKIYIQMGGIKLEVNKPNKANNEPNYADIHRFFGADEETYNVPFFSVFYDSGNNGNKQPNDRSTFFSLVYYWMKNVDNAYSLFFNTDGTIRKEISAADLNDDQLIALFTDQSRNNELCTMIINNDIRFGYFQKDSTNYAQFKRAIKAYARKSLEAGIPIVEMLGNFTVGDNGEVLGFETIPDALAIMPKRLNQGDLAVVFNAISDKLVTLDAVNVALGIDSPARFTSDGKILCFVNGVGDYLPACIAETSPDSRNSSLDNFLNTAKLGEKPQTLLAFFNGIDPQVNNDQLRMEAAFAASTNLDEVSAYYRKNRINIGRDWVKDKSDYDKMRRRAAVANMENLFNENERTDLDNWIEYQHRQDVGYISRDFDDTPIFVYNKAGEKSSIWEDNQVLEGLLSDAFSSIDQTGYSLEKFREWYTSLIKRYLGFSPSREKNAVAKDTFTKTEISDAAKKANEAISGGRLFTLGKTGENDFVSTSASGENRYIIPVLLSQDMEIVRRFKNAASDWSGMIEESETLCTQLLDQIEKSDIEDKRKRIIFNMIEALSTSTIGYRSGKIPVHYAKSGEYLSLIIKENENICDDLYGNEGSSTVRAISENNQKMIKERLDKQLQRGKRVVKSPFWAKGEKTFEVVSMNDGMLKVLNGMVEFNKTAKVLEPMLFPASAGERTIFGSFQNFGLMNGMLGRCISPYRSNVRTIVGDDATKRIVNEINGVSRIDDLKSIWNDFRILNLHGTTDFLSTKFDSTQDIKKYLAEEKKERTRLEKASGFAFDWAAGKGVMSKLQIKIFFNDLLRLISLDPALSSYWLAETGTVDSTGRRVTRFEEQLLRDPAKFFIECFQSNSSLLIPAKQAYNVALQGDAAAKTVQSIIFYETCAQHPLFRVFNSIFFSPFVQYGFNIVNRHLQAIAPVSTLNYLLVSWGCKSDLHIPWLYGKDDNGNATKLMLKDLNLEDAQVAADLREAMLIDISRMGTMLFAMLLASITGLLEPPEDEDKWGNIDEWTIFGARIKANWWIQDIIGPSLGYAAALVAAWKGKPCPQVFSNNLADCMFADPLMRASDGINLLFNPYGEYMESYYNDIDRFAGSVDGEPTALQVLGANVGIAALSTAFGFVTPSIAKSFYKESQVYETSYKNVYKTDAYGNIIRDETGNPVGVEKATYYEQKIRQACRSNPTFALVMEAVRALGGGGGTSYLANGMPRTIYYDPYQLESYQSLSLYTINEKGETVLKPDTEQQAIAYYCITQLLQYESMDDLVATGFCMPIETMRYVDDLLWDIYYYQKEIWDEWDKTGQLDPVYLGAGNFELGQQVLKAMKSEYDSLYDFWSDVHYNKLWSDQMKAGIQRYNRFATSYEQDANGEWYATGYRRGLSNLVFPVIMADGTLSNPGPTMGYENDWSTPSAVTGTPLWERVLTPIDENRIETPKFDSLGDAASGGYSKSYPTYMKAYGGYGSGGGGRSSYYPSSPRIYAPSGSTPRLQGPQTTYSTGRPVSNVDLDSYFIRPGFETKGSRKAYKREDI